MSALAETLYNPEAALAETFSLVVVEAQHIAYEDRFVTLASETVELFTDLVYSDQALRRNDLLTQIPVDDLNQQLWLIECDLREVSGLETPVFESSDDEGIFYGLNPQLEFIPMSTTDLEELVAFKPKPKIAPVVALRGLTKEVKRKPITFLETMRNLGPAEQKNLSINDNWFEYAECEGVDPDLFFPERGGSTKEAKAVCRACCVREICLEYALVTVQKFGIWGGESERGRRRIRRQRGIADVPETFADPAEAAL